MSDLLGIIAPLKKFLSKTEEKISMSLGNSDKEILSLATNRVYSIPDFQREIRWGEDNVAQLIDDISYSPKFLGNVILTQHSTDQFSIIDGQQRITVLTMILSCIKYHHGEKIDVFAPCELSIETFPEFSNILAKNFPSNKLEDVAIVKSDKLHQRYKYYNLWQYIVKHPTITNQIKSEKFLENLGKSTVNIILNKSTEISDGIRYFIDVNLKGKQLDTEDIFKSYLFKNDPSNPKIREEWYRFKENVTKATEYRMNYPLLKFLEHYLYCDLYKDPRYKGLEFGEDFLLKKEFKTREPDPQTFREGIHIIELIRNKTYMLQSLRKLNDAIEIMLEIVRSNSTTKEFEAYFRYSKNGHEVRIDSKELSIIHNIMGKVLKDSKNLPKALIMKYILSTLLNKEPKEKAELQKIYGVYLLAVLFTVFENKKSKDVLFSVLKAEDSSWYSELINQIKSYFSPEKITDTRLLAQYKLAANEEEDDYRFRCKSLATIYNFFKVDDNTVSIVKGKVNDLYEFITNDECYSVEHFIISESKTKETKITLNEQELDYSYDPKLYTKYVNSLFNFIFVPRAFNSDLKNYWLPHKLNLIDTTKIKCSYSLMYLEKIRELSKSIEETPIDESHYKDNLDLYFARDFKDLYVEFARSILKEVIEKIKT